MNVTNPSADSMALSVIDTPDWDKIDEDILCPLCDYNLRMLTVPRCPECGYRFEWSEMLDPRRRLHPYLFEHHPGRNYKSFRQTVFGGWRPKKFWTSLHPIQPSYPKRLMMYWCLAAGVLLFTLLCTYIFILVVTVNDDYSWQSKWVKNPTLQPMWRQHVLKQYGSAEAFLDGLYLRLLRTQVSSRYFWRNVSAVILVPLLWPWLTFAALMVFRWSMRLAKVKTIHVLRCCLYSFDIVSWYGLLLLGISIIVLMTISTPIFAYDYMTFNVICIWLLAVLVGVWRLWMAYRYYLRFNHSFMTVLSSQIIVFMLAMQLLFIINFRSAHAIVELLLPWLF
ncbi:MAG: hypothetical protein ACYTBZ_23245 [Planctomycetota bacterium]|jgi:hypothetical protein